MSSAALIECSEGQSLAEIHKFHLVEASQIQSHISAQKSVEKGSLNSISFLKSLTITSETM